MLIVKLQPPQKKTKTMPWIRYLVGTRLISFFGRVNPVIDEAQQTFKTMSITMYFGWVGWKAKFNASFLHLWGKQAD